MQFLRGDTLSTYIGIGMMVFLGLTVLEGRRAAAHTRDMLRLRFRMDELAAQRQQALDEAKRSSAVKSQFLATMSHEMRTPLHGMLGLTRLMRREGAAGSAAADRLEVMERTGEHLLNVINEVLEHSRLDGGHLKLRPLPFDPRALIDSVAGLMRPSALERGLALTLVDRLPPGLHLVGDAHRVRQVLLNLAGNALKFTDHGSVTIEAQLDAGRRLCIDVSDTGPGVAPEERERIFEAFRQLDGSFSRRHGGTGLGLTISRQLVEAMGGTIECRDAPGGGACFSVGLPLPTAAAPAPGMPPPPHRHSLSGRVLLVEDNPVNAMVAQETLRILGLEVVTVAGGEQAVACATRDRFDLILMDCQMPGVDGFEATSRIRRHERGTGADRVPIVALTANALLGDRERSLAAGMDDHIAKPFRDDDLIRVLGRLLPEVGSAAEA
jgi:signal transduction histidine kinase/ActR/RegA family two-component response regulator